MTYVATAFFFGLGMVLVNGLNIETAERIWFASCALGAHGFAEKLWSGK